MSTFEIIVLSAFTVGAGFMFWFHYEIINGEIVKSVRKSLEEITTQGFRNNDHFARKMAQIQKDYVAQFETSTNDLKLAHEVYHDTLYQLREEVARQKAINDGLRRDNAMLSRIIDKSKKREANAKNRTAR